MRQRYPLETLGIKDLIALSLLKNQDSLAVKELVARYECPQELYNATTEELQQIHGIGPARAVQLRAMLELGRRLLSDPDKRKAVIKSPGDVANMLLPEMRFLDREHFKAVYPNTKHHVISVETISIGSLNSSIVHPRELFKKAIKIGAGALIAVHNHPSGDPTPSVEDIEITRRLTKAGNIIGIQLLDQVVLGNGNWISLKEQGVI